MVKNKGENYEEYSNEENYEGPERLIKDYKIVIYYLEELQTFSLLVSFCRIWLQRPNGVKTSFEIKNENQLLIFPKYASLNYNE